MEFSKVGPTAARVGVFIGRSQDLLTVSLPSELSARLNLSMAGVDNDEALQKLFEIYKEEDEDDGQKYFEEDSLLMLCKEKGRCVWTRASCVSRISAAYLQE